MLSMAELGDDPSATSKLRNERPFLYPWNRRLRHLRGISLRNVHVAVSSPKRQTKTLADDDALYNLSSPAKRALQGDSKPLTQSRSFTNLATAASAADEAPHPGRFRKAATSAEQNDKQQARPVGERLRRRSTLHWSTTSPRARQSQLEEMVVNRLADTWISLHCPGIQEPIYVSEVIERSMNPSFAFFDLDTSGPLISRSDECTIRLWARASKTEDYCLLVELDLNLRSLQFIGRNLENFHHPLPQNCILLHLTDGIYTSFTDLPAESHHVVEHSVDHRVGSSKPGSTFDALMQLANLDECIQDAIKVRSQLEEDINKLLAQSHALSVENQHDAEIDDGNHQTKAALAAGQRQLRHLKKRRDELKESLEQRRQALKEGSGAELKSRLLTEERSKECRDLEAQLEGIEKECSGQIRRICESLLTIFPIEPLKNRPLQFTIGGIYLPSSVYDDTNRDEIAAALGFTAQLVYQLSLYLSTPLPYPLEPYGSASFINDPISIGLSQRRYPLHPTTVPYKFEYGVFLLNKDIEFLMNRSGLKVLDIRHTLPNLKYLLYVLSAGTGEMPARKAGGVRGLMGGRMTPDLIRPNSEDSVRSLSSSFRRPSAETRVNGGPVATREKEANDPFVTTAPATGVPYRHGLAGIR